MQKKGKRNKYRLAIEGKRRNTGGQGGVPLSAAETNLPKAYNDTSKRACYSRKNKELYEEKAETGVEGGFLALKTEILLKKGKNKHSGSRGFHIFSHNSVTSLIMTTTSS